MTTKTKKPAANNVTRRGFGRSTLSKPTLTQSFTVLSEETPSVAPQPIPTLLNTTHDIPSLPSYTMETSKSFPHIIQIRIDSFLFDSIHNAVESAIYGGNYSIESASHFIREALREHVAGAPLKVGHENGSKKSLSIRLDQNLKSFWDTLPKRHRNNILERAIRTKLLSYQN